MDQARPQAPRSTRWLALVVAGLVLAGVVSAGILVAEDGRPGPAVVSAAGGRSGTVDVTSTVTVPLPVQPSTPTSTLATTTTLPKAAADVLNAIAGSTTTTRRPAATTTTRPPASTTTVPGPTSAPPTSTTTAPARFAATLLNEHTQAVVLIVNGRNFPLAPAQTVDVDLPISMRGDLLQVRLVGDRDCGVSDSGVIFKPGGSYRVTIVESETMCNGSAARIPLFSIGPK